MADLGVHGFGTTITGSVTGAIGDVTNISFSGIDRDAIDITTMASTNKWSSFVPGMVNGGEITVTVNYVKAMAKTLEDNIGLAAETWTILFPNTDASTFVFSGYIKGLGTAIPHDDKVTQTVTIKVAGKPTFTV